MNTTTYTHVSEFLTRTRPLLEANEALNNMLLGACEGLLENTEQAGQAVFLGTVENEHEVHLSVLLNESDNLMLAQHCDTVEECVDNLIEHLSKENLRLPGVVGPTPLVDQFVEKWAARHAHTYALSLNIRTFELTEVTPPPNVSGEGRFATPADFEIVVQWTQAYLKAINAHLTLTEAQLHALTKERITNKTIFLWCDHGQPVSMSNQIRPTTNGMAINMVYTPREWRGRGYASACVAALSQHILDSGKAFVTLFTDLANPTTNKIYQSIGYRPLKDFNQYLFGKRLDQPAGFIETR